MCLDPFPVYTMASYFDEHDCRPLGEGEQPDHMMHMARLLIDTGYWNQVIDLLLG